MLNKTINKNARRQPQPASQIIQTIFNVVVFLHGGDNKLQLDLPCEYHTTHQHTPHEIKAHKATTNTAAKVTPTHDVTQDNTAAPKRSHDVNHNTPCQHSIHITARHANRP